MVYVIQVCWQFASCQQTPDNGQRNCPKHVEFTFQKQIWEISASSWFYYKNESRIKIFVSIPHSPYILQQLQVCIFKVFWKRYCKFCPSGEHGNGSPVTYTARTFFICGANISSWGGILLGGLIYLFCWLAQSVCVNARILLYSHLASHYLFVICIIVVIIVILPSSTVGQHH